MRLTQKLLDTLGSIRDFATGYDVIARDHGITVGAAYARVNRLRERGLVTWRGQDLALTALGETVLMEGEETAA